MSPEQQQQMVLCCEYLQWLLSFQAAVDEMDV